MEAQRWAFVYTEYCFLVILQSPGCEIITNRRWAFVLHDVYCDSRKERRRAALLPHPSATLYSRVTRVDHVLPIGLLNHNLSFFLSFFLSF